MRELDESLSRNFEPALALVRGRHVNSPTRKRGEGLYKIQARVAGDTYIMGEMR